MTILVQHQQPAGLETGQYWIDGSEAGFFQILRVYVPGPEVSNTQTWCRRRWRRAAGEQG